MTHIPGCQKVGSQVCESCGKCRTHALSSFNFLIEVFYPSACKETEVLFRSRLRVVPDEGCPISVFPWFVERSAEEAPGKSDARAPRLPETTRWKAAEDGRAISSAPLLQSKVDELSGARLPEKVVNPPLLSIVDFPSSVL